MYFMRRDKGSCISLERIRGHVFHEKGQGIMYFIRKDKRSCIS